MSDNEADIEYLRDRIGDLSGELEDEKRCIATLENLVATLLVGKRIDFWHPHVLKTGVVISSSNGMVYIRDDDDNRVSCQVSKINKVY